MERIIKTVGTLAAILAAAVIAVGCGNEAPLAPEYNPPKVEEEEKQKFSREMPTVELECLITGVQPTSIPCVKGVGGGETSPSWPITYVTINAGGKNKALIYPYCIGVHANARAKIKYRPLTNPLSSDDFIKNFVSTDISSIENFPLPGDGVITKDGIKYLEE